MKHYVIKVNIMFVNLSSAAFIDPLQNDASSIEFNWGVLGRRIGDQLVLNVVSGVIP